MDGAEDSYQDLCTELDAATIVDLLKSPEPDLSAALDAATASDLATPSTDLASTDLNVARDLSSGTPVAPKAHLAFAQPAGYDSVSDPTSFIAQFRLVDLNSDGALDIVTANWNPPPSENVSILLGRGDGTFAPATHLGGGYAWDVAAADLDRDGRIDLAISDSSIRVLSGNGDGTFGARRDYPAPIGASSCLGEDIADIDGDGWLDLAVACESSASSVVGVMRGGPRGLEPFVGSQVTGSFAYMPLSLGLWNHDGSLDIAIGTDAITPRKGSATILVTGSGGLPISASEVDQGNGMGVAFVDLDGDGRSELAIINTDGLQLYRKTEQGPRLTQAFPLPKNASGVTSVDFNADGFMDVAVGTPYAYDGVLIFLGDGHGSVVSPAFAVPDASTWKPPRTGDVNGDGLPDLVVAFGNRLLVLLNRSF